MSFSVVALVWSVISLTVAVSFWFSLLQPHWFIHNDSMTSLGVYSYCYHDDGDVTATLESPSGRYGQTCQVYGGPRFHFSKLPSLFWQVTCILLGSACVVASVCAVLATLTLCLPRQRDHTLAAVTGYLQIIAGLLTLSSFQHTIESTTDKPRT